MRSSSDNCIYIYLKDIICIPNSSFRVTLTKVRLSSHLFNIERGGCSKLQLSDNCRLLNGKRVFNYFFFSIFLNNLSNVTFDSFSYPIKKPAQNRQNVFCQRPLLYVSLMLSIPDSSDDTRFSVNFFWGLF